MSNTSTQSLLPIENIRNDVVIIKGGQLRAVLQVSSINLALKSQEEQEAIIFEYQNFLNSLDFPIQILVNSRLINIEGYLNDLREMLKKQESELLQMQTQEYIAFIERFVKEANIISRDFYVVVPFSTVEAALEAGGAQERFKSLIGKQSELSTAEKTKFMYHRGQLMQRVDFVASGLHRLGLSIKTLTTEELISLFWGLYNIGDMRKHGFIKPLF